MGPLSIAAAPSTYAVGDNVRVTVQAAFGVAVAGLVAGQVPDDERLVARTREKHVGAVAVSLQFAIRARLVAVWECRIRTSQGR
jgi:hypothetical protein